MATRQRSTAVTGPPVDCRAPPWARVARASPARRRPAAPLYLGRACRSKATQPEPAPFLVGVNLPWMHYGGDFGANAWSPDGRPLAPGAGARLDRVLGRLAAPRRARPALVPALRSGARAYGWTRPAAPAGIDACAAARPGHRAGALDRHGLRALFVLFDFLLLPGERRTWRADVRTPALGGRPRRRGPAAGPRRRAARGARADAPRDVRLGTDERARVGHLWGGGRRPVALRARVYDAQFLGERRHGPMRGPAAARSPSAWPACAGSTSRWRPRPRFLPGALVRPRRSPRRPLVTPAAAHGLDRPLVLGRVPHAAIRPTPAQRLAAVAHAGYAGAFAWSYCAEDQFSSAAVCDDEVAGWQPPRP